MREDVGSDVKISNGIVVIRFEKPVDVSIDRLNANAPNYISAARRDPDGRGIRIALAQPVKVNSMAAGERLFVDLLPSTWSALPPGLPQDIIEELTRRARDAERKLKIQRQLEQQKVIAPVRVRVATLPTLTRFVFELPELIAVAADRSKQRLSLSFDGLLKFDLADARAGKPPSVASIESTISDDAVQVEFVFANDVDVRTFREDNSFVVDLKPLAKKGAEGEPIIPTVRSETTIDQLTALAIEATEPKAAEPKATEPKTPPPLAAAVPAAAAVPVAPPEAETKLQPAMAEPPIAPEGEAKAPSMQAPSSPTTPSAPERPMLPVRAVAPTISVPLAKTEAPPLAPVAVMEEEPKGAATSPKPMTPTAAPMATEEEKPKPAATASATETMTAAPMAVVAEEEKPKAETPTSAPGNAAAPAEKTAAPEPSATAQPDDAKMAGIKVGAVRDADVLAVTFPFATPTPAAMFNRADTIWLVFDTDVPINVAALQAMKGSIVGAVAVTRLPDASVVRIRLERPQLTSLSIEGATWTVAIGNHVVAPSQPLAITRNIAGMARPSIVIPFDQPHTLHSLYDPDAGDALTVITALGPARGLVKSQEFVEFRALASTHGVVLRALADDLDTQLAADKIVVTRPEGLSLSAAGSGPGASDYQSLVLNARTWGSDREADFSKRWQGLVNQAADAPLEKRLPARLSLARFYLAFGMAAEAKGVLDVAIADTTPEPDDPTPFVLRGIAGVLTDRPDLALKDLAHPSIGNQYDAPLWRAMALARKGKWAEARKNFRGVEPTLTTLPMQLQWIVLRDMLRAAVEVKDFDAAKHLLDEFEAIGVPDQLKPTLSVLAGRVDEGLGKVEDALKAYLAAADSSDRRAAAEGRLREILLREARGEMARTDAIANLERLTAVWRGDETEIEALQLLARLYTDEGQYRQAFHVMRTALAVYSGSALTRTMQDEAARTFNSLFLAGKADAMPAIDALSLFYDYRALTPIGRRGDEMIRRLADRLVAVDLLYQAGQLLQHQVDHRLEGAARAQVAIRLAKIYLMDRRPDKALAALRDTATSGLTNDVRRQRLLLEARALSDTGRRELALEVIENIEGHEAIRLRSDIYWAAKRWREAAEQLEVLYGERWKQFDPLDETERRDILRAAIGYALAGDKIGLARFREKYAAKMGDGPDHRAFDVVTTPLSHEDAEFKTVEKSVTAVDTLEAFLRDLRTRYPDSDAQPPNVSSVNAPQQQAQQTEPATTGTTTAQ